MFSQRDLSEMGKNKVKLNLKKLLSSQNISLDLAGEDKRAVIAGMIDLLEATGKLGDREAALSCVLARERKMSTGMEHGIAIPHGKTDSVRSLVVGIGIHRRGVDFQSLDGQPAHIFIMTVSPRNRSGPHIQFLAEISRILNDETVRERLLAAGSAAEVIALMSG
jgi:fructose-specific phosphotransferase system IIA component